MNGCAHPGTSNMNRMATPSRCPTDPAMAKSVRTRSIVRTPRSVGSWLTSSGLVCTSTGSSAAGSALKIASWESFVLEPTHTRPGMRHHDGHDGGSTLDLSSHGAKHFHDRIADASRSNPQTCDLGSAGAVCPDADAERMGFLAATRHGHVYGSPDQRSVALARVGVAQPRDVRDEHDCRVGDGVPRRSHPWR